MDYRDHIALLRAGADGPDAFLDAIEERPDLDHADLMAFAKEQQVKPWLAACATGERAASLLPPDLLDDLAQAYADNAARTRRLVVQSGELQEALERADIGGLFLKGLVHARWLHGDPARRFQADVDLLVARRDLRRTIPELGRLGYDLSVDAATGQPLSDRVDAMLGLGRDRKPRNSCTLRRGERERLDLHWCIRTYYQRAASRDRLWRGRRSVEVGGVRLETPGEEDTLLVLLLNIAADLRKSRCRAKLFLDLYLACRQVDLQDSWSGFLSRRRDEGIERLAVNVLALFLWLWRCGPEFPELRKAVLERAHLIETLSSEEAAIIVERPRDDPANRRWHTRIHASSRLHEAYHRIAVEPGHTLRRLRRPRRGAELLTRG